MMILLKKGCRNMKKTKYIVSLFLVIGTLTTGTYFKDDISSIMTNITHEEVKSYELDNIPEYNGQDYVILNNNKPKFKESELNTQTYEKYSSFDSLGRCRSAIANIDYKMMPTEKRGSIGMIKPTGWHTIKYDNVDGKYLYNRCHLIGYQLTGENANELNLITCTRYMNTKSMLKFENEVAKYIKETKHHVLYRVTPIFKDNNMLASGVVMEAKSIEDNEIEFNVFVYNIQDGIDIDYKTGNSKLKQS